jgi:hypothetical protein
VLLLVLEDVPLPRAVEDCCVATQTMAVIRLAALAAQHAARCPGPPVAAEAEAWSSDRQDVLCQQERQVLQVLLALPVLPVVGYQPK